MRLFKKKRVTKSYRCIKEYDTDTTISPCFIFPLENETWYKGTKFYSDNLVFSVGELYECYIGEEFLIRIYHNEIKCHVIMPCYYEDYFNEHFEEELVR